MQARKKYRSITAAKPRRLANGKASTKHRKDGSVVSVGQWKNLLRSRRVSEGVQRGAVKGFSKIWHCRNDHPWAITQRNRATLVTAMVDLA